MIRLAIAASLLLSACVVDGDVETALFCPVDTTRVCNSLGGELTSGECLASAAAVDQPSYRVVAGAWYRLAAQDQVCDGVELEVTP